MPPRDPLEEEDYTPSEAKRPIIFSSSRFEVRGKDPNRKNQGTPSTPQRRRLQQATYGRAPFSPAGGGAGATGAIAGPMPMMNWRDPRGGV